MAEACDCDSREEIDIGVAVGVGERRAFAVIECDAREQRNPLAAGRDIALFSVENFLRLRPRDVSLGCRQFAVAGWNGVQFLILISDPRAVGELTGSARGAQSPARQAPAPGYNWASH